MNTIYVGIFGEPKQQQNDASDRSLTAVSYMPPASNLSRPIIALKNVRNYVYHIKKIEIVEADSGKPLHPRNIERLIIYPIESKYWVLFTDRRSEEGLPLPLQDLKEINKVTATKSLIPIPLKKELSFIPKKEKQVVEITFVGNKFFGHANKSFIATVNVEDDYIDEMINRMRTLRQLQYDSNYWTQHTMTLGGNEPKSFDIYPNVPFLGDGEEMVWQRLTFQVINGEKKVTSIDAITNCRIFQYNYGKHQGTGILFPILQNETVGNQHPTASIDSIGNYFITSYNLTGIKDPASNKILGDICFQAQNKSSITFMQITDPETLSTAVRRLKEKHVKTSIDGKNSKKSNVSGIKEAVLKCPSCQNVNASDSKFCNKCGSPLSMVCSKCGGSNTLSSLFCSGCGTKLAV